MERLWRLNRYLRGAKEFSRHDLLLGLLEFVQARQVCEIGVFRGKLAEHLLSNCAGIERYYLVDPWRTLESWGKPANLTDAAFADIYAEAMARTDPFADRRHVLRDEARIALREIPDGSLDAVYVDGDHTLRGITIDLINALPKLRPGGVLAGDDLTRNIWQHGTEYAPSQVFPFALYFAEAHGLPIFTMPQGQFVIANAPNKGFRLYDHGDFGSLTPQQIYAPRPGQA